MGGGALTVLLDTHALLWWLAGDERLSLPARNLLADRGTDALVSAASAWEICTKARLGRLPGAAALAADVRAAVLSQGFTPLAISFEHAERAGRLPGEHRDPFDRMIAAQAQALDIPVLSIDAALDPFGIRRIW